jgi:uncharacterized protein (UPF0333 family)
MKSKSPLILGAVLILVVIVGGVFFLSNNNTETKKESQTNETVMESSEVEKDTNNVDATENKDMETGPVPFSKIGKGIMDANNLYDYFSFENGKGTCMDQNFPTNIVYGPGNYMNTLDGKYGDNMTMVDFMGQIRFKNLPLSTGSASCVMKTSSKSDTATVSCSVDQAEVCTATFDVFGNKK